MTDAELEAFYLYAERNIKGYKRPADYKERVERILQGKRNPYRERSSDHGNQIL